MSSRQLIDLDDVTQGPQASNDWWTAFKGLRDNPLLRMWQLQDQRRAHASSRWLANYAMFLPTLFLSTAATVIIVRQFLAMLAEWRSGSISPLHASTALYASLHSLLILLIVYFSLLSLARFFQVLRSGYGFLANADSLSRTTLDDVMTIAPFSDIDITLAHAWRSIQLGLPPLAGLAVILGLHRVLWAWAALEYVRPSAGWIAANLLLLPLLSVLGSALALATFSSLVLGAGKLEQHNLSSAFGLLSLVLIQPALCWICYMSITRYVSPFSFQQLMLAVVLGLIPLLVMLVFIRLARQIEGVRRVLISSFSMIALLGFLLVLSICQLLAGRQGLGWEVWNSGPMAYAAASLQVFNVLPAAWDACGRSSIEFYQTVANSGSLSASSQTLARMLLPLPVLLLQLIALAGALSFARIMVHRQMLARPSPRETPRERGSRAPRARGDMPRLDRYLDALLLYLPLGLCVLVASLSLIRPRYAPDTGDELGDWLFSAVHDCQNAVVWSRTEQDRIMELRSGSGLSRQNLALIAIYHQFAMELQERVSRRQEQITDPADKARLEFLALQCEQRSMQEWDQELFDRIRRQQTDLLQALRDMDQLGALGLLQLATSTYWDLPRPQDMNSSPLRYKPFVEDEDSPFYSAKWMEPEDFLEIKGMYAQARASGEHIGMVNQHEAFRLLHSDNYEEGFRLLATTSGQSLLNPVQLGLAPLGIEVPEGLDLQSSNLLASVGNSNYNYNFMLNHMTIKEIASECIANTRQDRLAILHEHVWREDSVIQWDYRCYIDRVFLDALPSTVLSDPANRQFFTAAQDIRNLRMRHSNKTWTKLHFTSEQLSHMLGRTEELLAFGRASPYTNTAGGENSVYFSSGGNDDSLPLDNHEQQALAHIRKLDWNTLELPATP